MHKRMQLKKSTRIYIRWFIIAVVLTALYISFWKPEFNSATIYQSSQQNECPSLQRPTTSIENAYGMNSEVKKALTCRFEERRITLNRACQQTGPRDYVPHSSTEQERDGRNTYPEINSTICTLEKAGSSFWKRYLRFFKKNESYTLHPNEYKDTVKIAFVREPYSRLFSGFIDKLFSPNPAYWQNIGYHTVRDIRRDSSQHVHDVKCGFDVTFAELVDFMLLQYNSGLNFDSHFKPLHFRCGFCRMEYDYIGKMETFLDDVIYVSDVVGLLKYNLTRDFILKEGNNDVFEMQRNAKHLFQLRLDGIESCGVSLHQALQLTWRRWQIRGFIETSFSCPFKANNIGITWEDLYETALLAHRSSDKRKLADAKMAAIREAYSTLSLQSKLGLREMFLPQFDMFGYDALPDKVFGKYDNTRYGFSFLERKTIFEND